MKVIDQQIDRSGWPSGPWDDEPDRQDWEHAGLPCLALRNRLGGWCGYVGVPLGHPAHGKNYDAVDVDIHGGLTYAAGCQENGHICHVPREGEPDDVWWLGFDCCHLGDETPGMMRFESKMGWGEIYANTYKPLAYVTEATESLADQLAAQWTERPTAKA